MSHTIACNYLSTHMTKTCSAGQSKFKVLTVKLQSLPAHLGTFWRCLRKHFKGNKVRHTGILSFVVWKITMNNRKSIEEFLSDIDCDLLQYAGELRKKGFTSTLSAQYLYGSIFDRLAVQTCLEIVEVDRTPQSPWKAKLSRNSLKDDDPFVCTIVSNNMESWKDI